MKPLRHISLFATLIGALLLYAAFLWPLPAHYTTAIPHSSRTAGPQVETLVQGDHLQLLYHFQLAGSMVQGKIAPFTNPFEFNLGTDPRLVDPFYVPFSLVFAVAEPLAGDAVAWNLAQLASVLTGAWLLFLLARRWSGGNESIAAVASLAALCLPYRWEVLAGGSPTGFGMAWVPGIALGVDMVVRDGRARGGLLAGIMLLFCYTTDLHCFLFGILSLPLWYVISWLARPEGKLCPTREEFREVVVATLPLLGFIALSGGIAMALRRMYASTDAAGGRSLDDLCSPLPEGLFDPSSTTFMANQVFVGWGLAVLVGLGTLCALFAFVRAAIGVRTGASEKRLMVRKTFALLLLSGVILGMVFLALSTHGPMDGLVVRAARKLIPPFRMIRQPIKVFCLLPVIALPLFVFLQQSVRALSSALVLRLATGLVILGVAILPVAESLRAGLCSLPAQANGAYMAAQEEGEEAARALVLPIWPGDSSWSAIYLYNAEKSLLRMVNGYAAVKTADYLDRVYGTFETATLGDLTEAQIETLEEFKITAILVHEDAFPEKVSPCPVGATLRRFLAHPRLRLIGRDGPVWAFGLTEKPLPKAPAEGGILACARAWHFEGKGCVPAEIPCPFLVPLHRPAEWMNETFQWHVFKGDGTHEKIAVEPEDILLNSYLSLEGETPICDVLYTANPFLEIPEEGELVLPACDLFHAGWSETKETAEGPVLSGAVVIPAGAPSGEVLSGPNLMVKPGEGGLVVTIQGTNVEALQVVLQLGDQVVGPYPATEPLTVPLPQAPALLRIGLHLQAGWSGEDIRIDGIGLARGAR